METLTHTTRRTNTRTAPAMIMVDIDGGLRTQHELRARYQPTLLEVTPQDAAMRYWSDHASLLALRQRLLSTLGTLRDKVLFYGSSDYHHLSYAWLSTIDEPVTLIQFDNHTDLAKLPPRSLVHCGSWVIDALRLPHVRKVIQLGIDGDMRLVENPPVPVGTPLHELEPLRDGRVDIYPYAMRQSMIMGRLPIAHSFSGQFVARSYTTDIFWNNIRDHGGMAEAIARLLPTIPTEAVYLTIDKDVLREEDSFTNYYNGRQGTMPIDELLVAIRLLGQHKRIVAADVNGDGTYPQVPMSLMRRLFHRWKDSAIPMELFASPELAQRNEQGNLAIMEAFVAAMGR